MAFEKLDEAGYGLGFGYPKNAHLSACFLSPLMPGCWVQFFFPIHERAVIYKSPVNKEPLITINSELVWD